MFAVVVCCYSCFVGWYVLFRMGCIRLFSFFDYLLALLLCICASMLGGCLRTEVAFIGCLLFIDLRLVRGCFIMFKFVFG